MRPNNGDRNCEKQLIELKKMSCEKIITEDHSSAKERIQLINVIENLEQGDKVIIVNLHSLADSTRHLMELLQVVEEKGACIQSLKEEIDTGDGNRYRFSDIVKHLVEFQSNVISERTKKGLRRAQKMGVTTGRPRKPDENVQRAILMYESKKYSLAEIRSETGISKSTLYRYLEN